MKPAAAPNQRVCIAIPAFNEAQVIAGVIESLLPFGYRIVVVDDGSRDDTYQVCSRYPVDLLHHPVNLGYGAAQQTGVKWAARQDVDVIVTFDADGQHQASDIANLIRPILDGQADVAFGSRFLDAKPQNMPASKQLILKMAVLFTRFTTGLQMTDAHNGMRAFTRAAVSRMNLVQTGMAYSSELIAWLAKSGLRWQEVPVTVVYTDYSKKKGQSIWNLFNILWEILFS